MRMIVSLSWLFVLFSICGGCTSTTGHEIRQEQLSHIVKGKTTEAELVKMFGRPQTETTGGDGKRYLGWTYSHIDSGIIPMVGGEIRMQNFSAIIGADGTVQDYSISNSQSGDVRPW